MNEIKQNTTHNILETKATFLSNWFSIWPPLAAITLSSLPLKLFTAALNVFWEILAHSRSRNFFRASILSWAVAQASLFKMNHTQKSRGLKSGDEGGHNSFQNEGKWRWHKSCVAPVDSFVCRVRVRTVPLKGKWPIRKVFLHLSMGRSQNIVDVKVCVDFSI